MKRYELQCGNYKQYPALCAFFENQRTGLEQTDFFYVLLSNLSILISRPRILRGARAACVAVLNNSIL